MSFIRSLGRASFSLVFVGAMLGACDDDNDNNSSDESSQTSDDDSSETSGARAGRGASGGSGAARGGSGGSRSSEGAAGREASDAGASTATGGRRSTQGGSGGAGGAGRSAGGTGGSAQAGAAAAGTGGTGGTTVDAGTEPPAMTLDDGQIAQILSQVNSSEVSLGMLAIAGTVDPQVRDFAQAMIAAHNTAQARQAAVFEALNITLAPSSLSTVLNEASARTVSDLNAADATQFDLIYVGSQVDMHAQVVEVIDKQLLPSVTAETLRAELVLTRTEVSGHLDAARSLLTTLQGGEGADAGTP